MHIIMSLLTELKHYEKTVTSTYRLMCSNRPVRTSTYRRPLYLHINILSSIDVTAARRPNFIFYLIIWLFETLAVACLSVWSLINSSNIVSSLTIWLFELLIVITCDYFIAFLTPSYTRWINWFLKKLSSYLVVVFELRSIFINISRNLILLYGK